MKKFNQSILTTFLVLISINGFSESNSDTLNLINKRIEQFLNGSSVSAQLFLGYQYYNAEVEDHNDFGVKRGYITFSQKITPYLSGRITPDITLDREGDGEGDVEMRLKYCFAQLQNPHMQGLITEPKFVIGQVYTPFIEYEEKINLYRVEGAHFLDRIKQVSSADFGFTISGLIGGKINEDYQKRVNKNHAGKYGSFAFGLYNGGGYHSLEKNNNKTLQWRLTLRPFPNRLPGLQGSFTGVLGKGNTELSPDWNLYAGFLSYDHELFVLTGQLYQATGDHLGRLTDTNGKALKNSGYSVFSEIKFFKSKASLFGRWDYTEVKNQDNLYSSRYILGVAYHIQGKTKVVMDYNFLDNNEEHPNPELGIFEIMFELAF